MRASILCSPPPQAQSSLPSPPPPPPRSPHPTTDHRSAQNLSSPFLSTYFPDFPYADVSPPSPARVRSQSATDLGSMGNPGAPPQSHQIRTSLTSSRSPSTESTNESASRTIDSHEAPLSNTLPTNTAGPAIVTPEAHHVPYPQFFTHPQHVPNDLRHSGGSQNASTSRIGPNHDSDLEARLPISRSPYHFRLLRAILSSLRSDTQWVADVASRRIHSSLPTTTRQSQVGTQVLSQFS